MTNLALPPTTRPAIPPQPPISFGVYWYLQLDGAEKEDAIKEIQDRARVLARQLYDAMIDMVSGKNAPPQERMVRYETMQRAGTLELLRQYVPEEYDALMKDWHQMLSSRGVMQ